MNTYQEFIALSRYARFNSELGRREKWPETVDRLINFWKGQNLPGIDETLLEEIRKYIVELKVMPSMRSLMTAGEALRRSNAASYNCSFAAITGSGPMVELWDSKLADLGIEEPIKVKIHMPIVFDELFFLLLCGCGTGFSVERQFINDLPKVGKPLSRAIYKRTKANYPGVAKEELSSFNVPKNTIIVADSKYGWASALRIFIIEMYNGNFDVKVNVDLVRPAGMPLKIFGGRSSGSQSLVKMLEEVRSVFKAANGRKLTSIECHDIVCYIAAAVVVGGTRRSSTISLSNLSDLRMKEAKMGAWYVDNSQRSLANNSVAYSEKPTIGPFMNEWLALYDSRAGERGLFNRYVAQREATARGRDGTKLIGTNPCVTGDTRVLTRDGYFPIIDLLDKQVEIWNGEGWAPVTPFETGWSTIMEIKLSDGTSLRCTPNHKFVTVGKIGYGKLPEFIIAEDLEIGDRLAKFTMPVLDGGTDEPGAPDAYSQGFYSADGTKYSNISWVYFPKYPCIPRLIGVIKDEQWNKDSIRKYWNHGELKPKEWVPINASLEYRLNWLAGLLDGDGCITRDKNGHGIQISSINRKFLQELRLLLTTLGVSAKIVKRTPETIRKMPDGKGGCKGYLCKESQAVLIGNTDTINLIKLGIKFNRLKTSINKVPQRDARQFIKVISISECPLIEPTYCFTEPKTHRGTFEGIVTGNCGEIILRDKSFCNLTELVVRETDTLETLKDKARIATILGTMQSTLTDFEYLSKAWKENAEDERLLGVSMTGNMDHPILSSVNEEARSWLREISAYITEINKEWANKFHINQAAAARAVKPSGTVSQLVNSASGIHSRFAPYYIRRVRADEKDPLAIVMKEQGFPYDKDVMQPSTLVFSFPIKSPEGAVCRNDLTAIEQLEYWLMFKTEYTDHNPSVTISVREHEWLAVGAWVYEHFDQIIGISFLPYSDHVYQQAPYEEITKEKYEALLVALPTYIDYEALSKIELEDHTTSSQEYACVTGGCDL